MEQLNPVFDDILQSWVAPPPSAKPVAKPYKVVVMQGTERRVIVTRAMTIGDALTNISNQLSDEPARLLVEAL